MQCHRKLNLCLKFHPNRTMGSKLGGKWEMDNGGTDVENPRYSLKTTSLKLRNLFLRGISTRGLKQVLLVQWISEQPRIARCKALNETCEKRHGCCDIYSNPASLASKFLVGSATVAAVAGNTPSASPKSFFRKFGRVPYRGRSITAITNKCIFISC